DVGMPERAEDAHVPAESRGTAPGQRVEAGQLDERVTRGDAARKARGPGVAHQQGGASAGDGTRHEVNDRGGARDDQPGGAIRRAVEALGRIGGSQRGGSRREEEEDDRGAERVLSERRTGSPAQRAQSDPEV